MSIVITYEIYVYKEFNKKLNLFFKFDFIPKMNLLMIANKLSINHESLSLKHFIFFNNAIKLLSFNINKSELLNTWARYTMIRLFSK